MVKTVCFDKNLFIILILLIILIIYLIYSMTNYNCKNDTEQKISISGFNGIENNLKKISDNLENYQNNKEVINTVTYPNAVIDRDPKTLNSLDRISNPLRYPYRSDYFYDQSWYPNLQLPFQVIGCGSRSQPCLGGTQVPIYNPPVSIDISNNNIAPVNITTRGPLGQPQQVGILYKIYGNENDTLPLFGRKRYPNDSTYDYYTTVGQFASKVPVVTKNRKDELGTNDIVFIKGSSSPYRVTIYEGDYPQYIPYL
jgi:hypothetical protein